MDNIITIRCMQIVDFIYWTGPINDRQKAVVKAYQHAWAGYKKYAWGHDELMPLTKSYNDWFSLGLTIIDGLDTMYIMGLKDGKCIRKNYPIYHGKLA